eukprot:6165616-Pyramimonas_sp.AAC.1
MIQETGYTEPQLEARHSWNRGWKVAAIPARQTVGSVLSGGVAVLARAGPGLRFLQADQLIYDRRLQRVNLDLPGWPSLSPLNIDLRGSIVSTGENAEILAAVGRSLSSMATPCIMGGDWNMSGQDLEASGFSRTSSVALAIPDQVTFRGGTE